MLLKRRSRWRLPRQDSKGDKEFSNQVSTGTALQVNESFLERKALTELFQIYSLPWRLLYVFAVSRHICLLILKYYPRLGNRLVSPQKQQSRPANRRFDYIYDLPKEQEGLEENFLPIFNLFCLHRIRHKMGKNVKGTTM